MIGASDFTDYCDLAQQALLRVLGEVCTRIAGLHPEIAHVRSEERRARVHGFLASDATSVAGRERDSEATALEATVTLFDLQGQLHAAECERDFLLALLERQ